MRWVLGTLVGFHRFVSAPMDVGRRPKTIAIEENLWNPLGTRLFNIDRGPVPSGLDVADAGTPIGSFTPRVSGLSGVRSRTP